MRRRGSFDIQKSVFKAFLSRELKTRFGRFKLGFFWAVIEPLSHVIVLSVLFSFLRDKNNFFGIPFPTFFATGIIAFFAFQKVLIISIASIKVNLGLFIYRQVKPIDAIMVRALLQFFIYLVVVAILIFIGHWFFGLNTLPHDPLRSLFVFFLLFLMGLGFGFMTAVIGVIYEEWSQFITLTTRPLYFISGIFFPLAVLPIEVHSYLLWNPILHGVEEFRKSWIIGYPSENTSLLYLIIFTLIVFMVGLSYYRKNRFKILMQH